MFLFTFANVSYLEVLTIKIQRIMNRLRKIIGVVLILSLIGLVSCAELLTVINSTSSTSSSVSNTAGLKEALRVGIGNTVTKVSKTNGYFSDAAIKILLPPEAQVVVKNLKLIPGGETLVNDVVIRLNRAAEDAAVEAKPIFVNAITSMSIADATGILFGNNDAATVYLKQKTYSQLKTAFQPKIKASLDKPLVANVSTNQSWSKLVGAYNKVANTTAGKIANLTPVNVSLDAYVTEKALSGMFVKLAAEEKAIRLDPAARVNSVLKTVFGQLDK